MKKNKKIAVVALCMLAVMAAPSLAAEPLPPEGEPAAQAASPDAAPGGPDVKADEETEASDGTSESAGEGVSSPPYRHRPGACPEGPPCQTE